MPGTPGRRRLRFFDRAAAGVFLDAAETTMLGVIARNRLEPAMADYLLIESRDPFESGDTGFCHDLACRLAAAGDKVTVFLVQNGVLPARAGAQAPGLGAVLDAGVEVLADEFSLRERGIAAGRLRPGIRPASLDTIVDRMAAGSKAIWH